MMINTLPAGPPLDAQVALRLIGWAEVWALGEHPDPSLVVWYGRPTANSAAEPVPPYSWDIAAAWEVVERVGQVGHRLVLEDWLDGDATTVRGWCALFFLANGHDTGQVVAESAPEAICRAALKTLGPPAQ